MTPSAYPEVHEQYPDGGDVMLWCAGCADWHAASTFAFVTKRGAGKGRMVECRRAHVSRLAANAERRGKGQATVPAPRLDPTWVAPST